MLFDETNFGELKVKNHLVRSATFELGTTPQGELLVHLNFFQIK